MITKRKVQPRRLFKRNQIVIVEARAGALRVRNRARALDDGRAGDVVTCLNLDSKQEFQGVVRKDGVVVVQ